MSDKPTVFVTRRLPPDVEARLARDYRAVLNDGDAAYDAGDLVEKSREAGADAILTCGTERFTADVIERLPGHVKILATFSVGYDHIDVAAAKSRGLVVTNTPDVLTDATADITMLCLLGAARQAQNAERVLRQGRWGRWAAMDMLGVEVTGKRLGIYGMGRIGQAVARRARGFDMEIHYSNRSRLPPEAEQGAIYYADPHKMLPHCDFLSTNCPGSVETRHFVNERRIELLPDGAIVVNTARGSVIDDDALIPALQSGKLAAAGLDVYAGEPDFDKRYLSLSNVFLLPHIGSATIETRNGMGFRALDNLDSWFAGREPRDRVA
ncbi:MAG: D-glycerate dehydrogenase [Alphaproteobacteria bacterium]|nr:D-glycerate dehydrogenase [Alphaproteobacteria bacterium]